MSLRPITVRKIISGAQAGADMGGLLAGLDLRIPVGGWVPKGRRTERGPLNDQQMRDFNLREHSSKDYADRTAANIRESDGTVVVGDEQSPGSRLTIGVCKGLAKPCIVNPTVAGLRFWLAHNGIVILNVAGNRESRNPGVEKRTRDLIVFALSAPEEPKR